MNGTCEACLYERDADGTCGCPTCARCGDVITGCIWSGGVCLDCHERALLPESPLDRWEATYA